MKETKKNGAAQSKAGKRDYSAFKNMYRKIPQDLRDVIVYYIGDRPLVIHEGVNEVTGEVVTAEFIRQWHIHILDETCFCIPASLCRRSIWSCQAQ